MMPRCAKVGVGKCGCHPLDLLLWPQPLSEGMTLRAKLSAFPPNPHPLLQGPGTWLCPRGLLSHDPAVCYGLTFFPQPWISN